MANEVIVIAEYPSLDAFERERAARRAAPDYMKLSRTTEELMTPGTFRDELLEREIHTWLRDDKGYQAIRPSTAWGGCWGPISWPRSATSIASRTPRPCAHGRD
ncbi:MAG: hypothetical protein LC799_01455 [Actinobacteria bacterium]|nr:hypothetical protein [Actinomycetota bacterium]